MIERSIDNSVLTLRIANASQANALTAEILQGLREAFYQASKSNEIRGILLTSTGQKGFSAGMHTAQFEHQDSGRALQTIQLLGSVCDAIKRCNVPVAVAIQGYCIGGALEIAAAADFRVGTETSWYSMPEVRIGIPSVLESVNLSRLLGWTKAVELMLTGVRFSAPEMVSYGFLNRTVPEGEADRTAVTYLEHCMESDRVVIAQQKQLFLTWKNVSERHAISDSEKEFALAFARRNDGAA